MRRTTRNAGALKRLVAAVLTVTLAGYWVPASALAAGQTAAVAEIGGTVLLPDGLTPVSGASVKAANVDSERIYSSVTTGQDGSYRLTDLPAGTYDLAVETADGLYASDRLVEAISGKRVIVTLAITKSVLENQQGEEEKPQGEKPAEGEEGKKADDEKKEGEKKEEAPPEPEGEKKKKGKSFWRTPWAALAGIIPAAIVLGIAGNAAAGDDDDSSDMTQSKRGN